VAFAPQYFHLSDGRTRGVFMTSYNPLPYKALPCVLCCPLSLVPTSHVCATQRYWSTYGRDSAHITELTLNIVLQIIEFRKYWILARPLSHACPSSPQCYCTSRCCTTRTDKSRLTPLGGSLLRSTSSAFLVSPGQSHNVTLVKL
jgi:hypothetical protein